MFLSADVVSLLLYCAQQLGVTLGVGAQTIMLVAYLSAMRDGVVDAKEAQFARAVRAVLNTGLVLVVLSGIGITILHGIAGQGDTVFSPAYLFKWLLIAAVLASTLLKNLPQHIMQGLAGGTWYALFVVHILAPVASWANLLTLYLVWILGFGICWWVLVLTTKEKKGSTKKIIKPAPPMPKPASPPLKLIPPPKPAPAAPARVPVLEQKHILQTLPQPEVPKPAPTAPVREQNPWLPAVQIMPKTPNDAQKQNPPAPIPHK
ncbi:MAG: hypothetical protein Q7R71_00975 [bacterium]|nr:hypothetical protein [bacterium]